MDLTPEQEVELLDDFRNGRIMRCPHCGGEVRLEKMEGEGLVRQSQHSLCCASCGQYEVKTWPGLL
jgi:hypothetical protein